MSTLTRRNFATLALGGITTFPLATAQAIDPITRTGKPLIKLAVAAYSFRKFLDLKGKTPPTMTMEQFAEWVAGIGLGAVEPTSYYFPDTSNTAMARYKLHCAKLGLDITGTAVGNDFTTPDAAKQKTQMQLVKDWVEKCSILGGKTIRIFAGNLPKGDTLPKAQERCINAIGQACDHAAQYGVILALENHGGITARVEDLLTLVKRVNHPNFGVNLDTGNFRTDDPYGDLEKIAPYAVVAQLKTEMHPKGKDKEPANLKRLVGMLQKVNFRGYLAVEHEANEDPKEGVLRAITELKQWVGGAA
ncbi:MAG: sugar phosphate isomerase/epimerase family protein [Gemmataceae bacterium]